MKKLYHSLLLLVAGATQKELAAQIRYLKVENEILRGKCPPRVSVTRRERNRLVKFGSKLGKALHQLVTIVHPDTLRRWIREANQPAAKPAVTRGRPRTPDDIRALILKLAHENDWGYTRILGELKKLGVGPVSRSTVKNILQEHGLDPGPKRGPGTWDEFLKIHAATLWQCDFFSKRVLTPLGLRHLFVLVFLHVGTRRVVVSPATHHPNEAWVQEQADAFLQHVRATGLGADIVMHDRDKNFPASFDQTLRAAGLRPEKAAPHAPNTMAFVERFIQTVQQECLDYFLVFGERHMNYLVSEMVAYYHASRPHQGLDNAILVPPDDPSPANRNPAQPLSIACHDSPSPRPRVSPSPPLPLSALGCHERLGGLLKHYYRKAA
jgi:putative transposase